MARKLKSLGIKCTSADCENGLHCFRQTKKMAAANAGGKCRYCGEELVDLQRLHERKLDDVHYTFSALKQEFVRHFFWHLDIDLKAVNHARRKGKIGIRVAAENRIRKSVGPENPPFDGRQTPKGGNVIFYAQHATASCCRACIEEWHGIPHDRALTDDEINYLAELTMLYIEERMPNLKEQGEYVPNTPSLKTLRKNAAAMEKN